MQYNQFVRETNFLKLSDGNRLCYAEYGDPNGIPVLMFHGNPGSRLAWGAMPGSPFLPNVRIIAPDRPGYGFTSYKDNALARWPQDVEELLDHLWIPKAHVFAPSGGAPFALACAWKIPSRIRALGLFGAVGPNHPDAVTGAMASLRLLWWIAGKLPALIRLQMRAFGWLARRDPLKLANMMRDLELSGTDKVVFDKPEIQKLFQRDFVEAYRQDGIGSAYDASIPGSWPIPLEEVRTKTLIWHAERDHLVGSMPVYLHHRLPNSTLSIIPDQGHLWILDHIPETLQQLLEEETGDLVTLTPRDLFFNHHQASPAIGTPRTLDRKTRCLHRGA